MKYIRKRRSPGELNDWKNANRTPITLGEMVWEDLDTAAKESTRSSLLLEQGCLCCYCGARVKPQSGHVEHIKSQSRFPDERFNYKNLLFSCDGGQRNARTVSGRRPGPRHCGPRKADTFRERMVTPLERICEDCFIYTADGQILPNDRSARSADAQMTIEILGLDEARVKNARQAAIAQVIEDEHGRVIRLSDDEIERLARAFEQPDEDGRFQPYCFPIVQVLKSIV